MPRHRTKQAEINLAEGDEKNEDHTHRQDGGKERPHRRRRLVQLRGEGKYQIKHCTRSHGYRQRPVLDKSYDVHNEAAKVRHFLEKSKKML